MQLRKVKWKGHPLLGDLQLDFTISMDSAFKTIILAGENGAGKSTILESISSFMTGHPMPDFEYIEYQIDDSVFQVVPRIDEFSPGPQGSLFAVKQSGSNDAILDLRSDSMGMQDFRSLDARDPRHYGSAYSKARVDFRAGMITSTTSSELDSLNRPIEETEDFTSLKQLLVNTWGRDESDYALLNQSRGDNPVSWPDFHRTSKISRFMNSFNNFFEVLKFEAVVDSNAAKEIRFRKNDLAVGIDHLSTGEKQVVFRGAYLLRNSNATKNGVIFVDEPELSMHPKWQRKILRYYKGLFTVDGSQTAQLFFATHSDHVLKEAFRGEETVVITLERKGAELHAKRHEGVSPTSVLTSAEVNYVAFDLPSVDYHIELYGRLQAKIKESSVSACDRYIAGHSSYEPGRHAKLSSHGKIRYETLPTFVRNAIHHSDNGNSYTDLELRQSIELLIGLLS